MFLFWDLISVDMLMEKIENGKAEQGKVVIPTKIILRETTANL